MKKRRGTIATGLLLIVTLLVTTTAASFAVGTTDRKEMAEKAAAYVYQTVKEPQVASIGGEWAVLGLARGSYAVDREYYQNYYNTVEMYVKEQKGILHEKKYTEYSRVILALTAIGADPTNVGGYNLLTPLGDFEKTIWQGLNGSVWALIALDSANYPMPTNPAAKVQASRKLYVDEILKRQLADGGFALTGTVAEADMTGMVLQALSNYRDRADVKVAIEKALNCLSKLQNKNGGFLMNQAESSESCVQVMVGLNALGIPLEDSRFVKNGNSVLDHLMSYYVAGSGFRHMADDSRVNLMASEQCLYAIVDAQRAEQKRNSLYAMDDVTMKIGSEQLKTEGNGLSGKHGDVKKREVVTSGKTFGDVAGHKNQKAIEGLAERNMISGKGENRFDPNATMTRAEFATIIVNGLGLPEKKAENFSDVKQDAWYADFVGSAASYGIVSGTSKTSFNPNGTITRQEAATMIANAAKLCGIKTELAETEIKDMLTQFDDYTSVSPWAKPYVAFCYTENILPQEELEILPKQKMKRCEIAEMLYRMLATAKLI